MSANQALDYYAVVDALARAGASVEAADCHGLLAGLVAAGGFADPMRWVPQVFEQYNPKDLAAAEAYRMIQALAEATALHVNSPDLNFELLLPDDEDSLRERAEALGKWCGGFLGGLGLGGLPDSGVLPEGVAELLDDLTEIARVDFELDTPEEAELAAFEEVVEYVRVGVLFINEELQPIQAPQRIQ